ncbi:unnamed protein product [Rotaria socialis]|uniref:Uncharacterized protein n=1 Tax=Rotaria socialis TaxID=392032 RepID=A0A818P2H3_9BILA|nr:unnamed protein product [Rotaria socialis]
MQGTTSSAKKEKPEQTPPKFKKEGTSWRYNKSRARIADAETIPTDRIQPIFLKRIRSSKSVATSVYTNEVDFDDIVKFQNLSAISKSSIPTIITDNFARPARRMETLNQLQGQTISASGKTGIKVHDHNSSNVREQWQSYISRAGGRQVDTDLRSVKQSNFRLPIPVRMPL